MTFKILGDHSYITWALFVINHNIFTKIWASCAPTHFLANQLTLSQPGGAHYPHPVLRAPPQIFRPCDGPAVHWCIIYEEGKIRYLPKSEHIQRNLK